MLGKLINGNLKTAHGKVLVTEESITVNPREEDWVAAGYKEIVQGELLSEKEGFYQVPEYTEENDKILVTYHYEELTNEL